MARESINVRRTNRREELLEQIAEYMKEQGIPSQRGNGSRNDTAVIEYALEQTAKLVKRRKGQDK